MATRRLFKKETEVFRPVFRKESYNIKLTKQSKELWPCMVDEMSYSISQCDHPMSFDITRVHSIDTSATLELSVSIRIPRINRGGVEFINIGDNFNCERSDDRELGNVSDMSLFGLHKGIEIYSKHLRSDPNMEGKQYMFHDGTVALTGKHLLEKLNHIDEVIIGYEATKYEAGVVEVARGMAIRKEEQSDQK